MLKYKCIVFDLDGTIYFGNKPAPQANNIIKKARKLYKHVFFLTNNSAKTRKQVLEKLVDLGIDAKLEELITSSYAIVKYLQTNNYKEVYCIGTNDLIQEIELAGIYAKSQTPQAIIVGYNPDFKLNDLNELANIQSSNCELIVANKERNYPKENGYILPGAGPIVCAVETLLNKTTDIIVGKPNTEMLKITLSNLNIQPDEICIVGDSYDSDIKMAQNFGAQGILITKEKRNDCQCITQLADLLEIMK